ncbi:hypothetical protein [Polynucleobacter sp.]|jgi:2-polyprenyl-3-methyl-5-hydroxy-6-metoxy-1,4-benzoquinol methylase|uniref:hypothetical protein n=1 Tax=Polynucleobacter sp. TaxID=2029855 RepID=UPI0037C5DE57
MNEKQIFSTIYEKNAWGSVESISGPGSSLAATKFLIRELAFLLKKYSIKSVLDIPCGDFNWMQTLDLSSIEYLGADIVDSLIQKNSERYPENKFAVLNLLKDRLPAVDLVICRDCLFHFPNEEIHVALKNIKSSGSKFLLTTSFGWKTWPNLDIEMGGFRRLNLELTPFNMPAPLERIIEGNLESEPQAGRQADRSMCLWACKDLPD